MKSPFILNLSTTQKSKLLKELLHDLEKEWMQMTIQEYIYAGEYAKPKNISKEKALENMGQYQQRIRYIEENIFALKHFAHEKKINI